MLRCERAPNPRSADNMRESRMTDGIASLRRKLPEIAVEAAMVVFAVFAAFGVRQVLEHYSRAFARREGGLG